MRFALVVIFVTSSHENSVKPCAVWLHRHCIAQSKRVGILHMTVQICCTCAEIADKIIGTPLSGVCSGAATKTV